MMDGKHETMADHDSWSETTRQASNIMPDDTEKTHGQAVVDTIIATPTSAGNTKISLFQATKLYPRIVGYCLGLSSAILLYGYDLVIVGTVAALPQFQ